MLPPLNRQSLIARSQCPDLLHRSNRTPRVNRDPAAFLRSLKGDLITRWLVVMSLRFCTLLLMAVRPPSDSQAATEFLR